MHLGLFVCMFVCLYVCVAQKLLLQFDMIFLPKGSVLVARSSKAGHRSNLASLRFCLNAATERRKHTQVDFCGLRGAFEQSLCFRSTGNVWTPAYSRPCYRRQDARVKHALLEQLTLFPNASIVLEDVDTHRSNFRRRVKTQTIARKRWHGARKRKRSNVTSTCGRLKIIRILIWTPEFEIMIYRTRTKYVMMSNVCPDEKLHYDIRGES